VIFLKVATLTFHYFFFTNLCNLILNLHLFSDNFLEDTFTHFLNKSTAREVLEKELYNKKINEILIFLFE